MKIIRIIRVRCSIHLYQNKTSKCQLVLLRQGLPFRKGGSGSFALLQAVELYESETDSLDADCSNTAIAMSIVRTISDRLDKRLFCGE